MGRINTILFDMDGVLIDAKDWHYEALNDALTLFGLSIARDEHLAVYDGLPTRRKLEILSASRGLPRQLHEFINEIKQQHTMRLSYQKCRPMFHHQYALSKLKHEGYKLAVCSNSIRNTVQVMTAQAGLSQYLDLLLSNEDVSRAKPHPEIYSTAMQRLAVDPASCLVVEDNENGIKAARDSGAHVMEVASVHDVTYDRIHRFIEDAEAAPA